MINRREFITGCTGLSFIDLEANDQKEVKTLPVLKKNVVLVSSNYGFFSKKLIPSGNELDSEYLNLFEEYKDKITLLKRIEQAEMGGGHGSHTSVFTALSNEYANNGPRVSLDQVIADRTKQSTRLKSLVLGTNNTHISWSVNGQKIPQINQVDKIYSKVFLEKTSSHILNTKINQLKYQLSKTNSELYQESILQLISQYENEIYWADKPLPKTDFTYNKTGTQFTDLPTYFDLIVETILKDQCKIFTMNIGSEAGVPNSKVINTYPYSLLKNLKVDYHTLTHHQSKKGYPEQLENIEKFEFYSFKNFIDNLDKNKLLDDTVVVILGGFSDSASHSTRNLPLLVIGGGLNHKKVVDCKDQKGKQRYRLSDFYVTLMNYLGVDQNHFAGYKSNMNVEFGIEV